MTERNVLLLCCLIAVFAAAISAYTDIQNRRIANRVSLPLVPLAFLLHGLGGGLVACAPVAIATLFTGSIYYLLWRKGAMGGGDVKLATGLAALFGPLALLFQLCTVACGGALAAYYMIRERRISTGVPYALALLGGALWTTLEAWIGGLLPFLA